MFSLRNRSMMNLSLSKNRKLKWIAALLLFFLFSGTHVVRADEAYYQHMQQLDRDIQFRQNLERQGQQSRQNQTHFCAIAYSKSTGKWGSAYGKGSRDDAEQEALRQCGEQDGKVLCWTKGSWYCALADGPDSYGAAPGETAADAKAAALKIANDIAKGAKIVLVVGGPQSTIWQEE
jgi:Domain of unknown function (DUF4189)